MIDIGNVIAGYIVVLVIYVLILKNGVKNDMNFV